MHAWPWLLTQVAETMGDKVTIYKLNTDDNPDLASQLQIQGLPTMIFVSMDASKPALRTEGLLPAATIIDIVMKELLPSESPAESTTESPAVSP